MKMKCKFLCMALGTLLTAGASMGQVVISQVYGGGGNAGATFNQDFVELFNRGTTPVNLTGYSVQYQTQGASTWALVGAPTATLQPGQYYLISGLSGATGAALPAIDLVGAAVNINATQGKIVLVNNTTAVLPTGCPASGVADLVGFGTTSVTCNEGGTNAAAPSGNANSLQRVNGGCTDNNVNASDFGAGAVNPRNTASPLNVCPTTTPPSGSGSAAPATVCPSAQVTLNFTVTPGSPANAIQSVSADGSLIGAGTINFVSTGANTWQAAGVVVSPSAAVGTQILPVTITEVGGRTGSSTVNVIVGNCTLGLTTGTGFSPSTVCAGSDITFTAVVRKNQITPPGTSTGIAVSLDLAPLGGVNGTAMTDLGDDVVNPNLRRFSYTFTTSNTLISGGYFVQIHLSDAQSNPTGTINPFNVNITSCTNSTSDVVISQFYGGGGATTGTPTYKVDFVEIFNRSSAAVNITGWTIQYASSTGPSSGTWAKSPDLTGSIPAGGYYLVSFEQVATSVGADLSVTPDLFVGLGTGNLSMSATDGKVALVSSNVALTTTMPVDPSIKDLVGFGSAGFFEGAAAAPGPTNQLSLFRSLNGCQDFDQNGADLFTAAPAPRTSTSPLNNCSGAPSGKCCAPAGTCSLTIQSACTGPSVWTLAGTCTPNTCPQPASGVCCRGSTCNTTFADAAACAAGLTGSPTAGAFFVSSTSTCNASATVNTPCCYADYNKIGGISVQDIFDFLGDWFAGFPYANTGGNGTPASLQVQNIFDFLSDWFAGGC